MTQLAERPQNIPLVQPAGFNPEQIDLIKNTVAVGTSDLELALFLEVCRSTGLNPFQRQVYAVVRKGKTRQDNQWVETSKMVIQTGIDGYRLIAARSGVHMGTTDPEFGPLKDGYPEFARVIVRKLVHGQMVEFPATARWAEYVQTKAEYQNGSATGKQIVSDMWAKMLHTMLGKCSEALALRKAFPAELSGVYSDVEMQQADNPPAEAAPVQQQARTVDVTREVAQSSGAPLHSNPDTDPARLNPWRDKLKATCEKLSVYPGGKQRAIVELKNHAWGTSVAGCNTAYEALKRIGVELKTAQDAEDGAARTAQEDELPGQNESVQTEALITSTQRGTLMGHIKRTGIANDSAPRARFYHWFLPAEVPEVTPTNELTEAQTASLIAALSNLDNDAAQQTGTEFSNADLPF